MQTSQRLATRTVQMADARTARAIHTRGMTTDIRHDASPDSDWTTGLLDGAGAIIRPGEHACCRFGSASGRTRVVASVIGHVLRRGDRAVYLHDRVDAHELISDLADADEAVGTALERGQLVVSSPRVQAVEGTFDIDFLLGCCSDERDRALADGYEGLTLIVEVGASIADAQTLEDFEGRLDALASPATAILCINSRLSSSDSCSGGAG